jgi:hypothetical protein
MDLEEFQSKIKDLKALLPTLTAIAGTAEKFLTEEQKASLEKALTALKEIPVEEMGKTLLSAAEELNKDVKVTKAQLIIAGVAIATVVHLLHKKN